MQNHYFVFSFLNFVTGYQNSWGGFYNRAAVGFVCVHFALLCCGYQNLLLCHAYAHRTPIRIPSLPTQVLPYFLMYMYCVCDHLGNPGMGYMYVHIASHRRICGSCWFLPCKQQYTPCVFHSWSTMTVTATIIVWRNSWQLKIHSAWDLIMKNSFCSRV